ncbi:MAG TPA: tRNA (N6-isopentenyl adenosine(37)-C2)-methylthiotransferase MiaB [Fibrobacteraceae bacterium]|nr:tRNA (N6-isopentenyl adenosine(37)-C2)-methylthiotransferase MiaB [Fibrobacteraceae bacterium]
MKYHIATFGCQMNEYDSGLLANLLESVGCQVTSKKEEADFIFFNTCSIREKAEDTAIARISQIKSLKYKNPNLKIIIVGCMAKNKGKALFKRLPFIDYVIGPDHYKEIPEIILKQKSYQRVYTEFDETENYQGAYAKLQTPYSTSIGIQRGCNKRCSYCIVPYVRGKEKNRDPLDILAEVQSAADRGVSEIMLLGQTVNAYHKDDFSFATLLDKISQINGIERIRFTSPHPKHYNDELIDVLLSNSKICNHVHLPLQSGSDAILKKMRRQYNVENFLSIVERFRNNNPLYAVTTDIISGFVGETDEDFEQTLEVVKKAQFDNAFMFIYSPRAGTESFQEKETLSEEEKQERHERLVVIQNEITMQRNKLMFNRNEKILVERPSTKDPDEWVDKTENFKKVIFKPTKIVHPGDYVVCHINDIRGWTLRGEVVGE